MVQDTECDCSGCDVCATGLDSNSEPHQRLRESDDLRGSFAEFDNHRIPIGFGETCFGERAATQMGSETPGLTTFLPAVGSSNSHRQRTSLKCCEHGTAGPFRGTLPPRGRNKLRFLWQRTIRPPEESENLFAPCSVCSGCVVKERGRKIDCVTSC